MVNLIVDTSVVIAVVTNEPAKDEIISVTRGADLIAPSSLVWELGNAFSGMFKRARLSVEQAVEAFLAYSGIPIRSVDVDIPNALALSHTLNIYAYDAYFLVCAQKYNSPLITLDRKLNVAAAQANVETIEVAQ